MVFHGDPDFVHEGKVTEAVGRYSSYGIVT